MSDEHNPNMLGCAGHPLVLQNLDTSKNCTPVPDDVVARLS